MRKIVITGPECSGKSALSQALAEYYGMPWVPEYARWYLEHLPRGYEARDLISIALGQEGAVFNCTAQFPEASGIFIDTWLVVLQIWYRYRFGAPPAFFEAMRGRHAIDHYLLCRPDLPWTEDPLRENPNDRDELFEVYRAFLTDMGASYTIISGRGDARQEDAIRALSFLTP